MPGGPTSPRGWLNWAVSVREWYASPRISRYEFIPYGDWRTNDMRETAISIIRLCEKSANGNGGAGLLYSFYVEEASWYSYTESEQRIIEKTARCFAAALREAGFIEGKG